MYGPRAKIQLVPAKAVIDAHGGTIKLSSQPGKGTTVTVTIPAQRNRQN
ncbi:hypothetical protein QEH68_09915 [Paenarthrobacter sp. OM7]|nr:ATP-binding protein [Paenarthrobacter sp. OM7]WGM22458.1 hypothetical protein QEH68_09915 [Paenarthrobacter sp. OM7]